jgi:hypothetical protein
MEETQLAAIRERYNAIGSIAGCEQRPFEIAATGKTVNLRVLQRLSTADKQNIHAFYLGAIDDIPALLAEVARLRTRDVHYEAEFKRIEAIAVKKANAVAPYEVLPPNENTTCPKCNAHPRLLCAADWQPELPAFYVCGCGYIGQIGVGPVIEQSA